MEGWIKLHRSIIDSSVFQDADALKLWIWLLCNAAYEDHETVYLGNVISINKGQIVTGRKKISQQIGMSESKVYRAMNILKGLGNISVRSTNRYSIITINNWLKYQNEMPKITIDFAPKQQQNDSKLNSKANSKTTANQTANQQQTEHNKRNIEYKEREESKKEGGYALSGERFGEINSAGLPIIDFGFKDRGF